MFQRDKIDFADGFTLSKDASIIMTLLTTDYLRQHGLDQLVQNFKLHHKRHSVHKNLVLLKYNQIESPMYEPICQECRGLILDEDKNWEPVCFPYRKFWNYGEGHAAKINWESAKCTEKLDGSIISMFYYKGEWHTSTSGTPDGIAPVNSTREILFKDLFWKVWQELNYQLPQETYFCYMFELLTPYNRVVVPANKNRIVLHGVRNMVTLAEVFPEMIASQYGWECAKIFDLNNIENILKAADQINPMESEGYVIRDQFFRRVKVKSPQYVALHHLKEGMSEKRLLELIRTNESQEFLAYFPDYRDMYEQIKSKFDELRKNIMETYNKNKHLTDQKEFAMQVKDEPYSFACFSLRKGIELNTILKDVSIDRLLNILDIKEQQQVAHDDCS